MGVEMCTRCDTHVDLDYNTNGAYLNETKYTAGEYVCEHCLTEPELDKLEKEESDGK
jgi:hypothetical protein